MTLTEQRPAAASGAISVTSLPARLRDVAHRNPNGVALREKEFGIWEETTFAEYWDMVQVVGMALRALGVGAGDKIGVHSENRKAWVFAELGAQAIQAASVGLYPTNPASEVQYLLSNSEAKVLIAEDQEQVDKALAVKAECPHLSKIVYVEPRGVRSYDDPNLMSWDEFVELGRAELASDPGRVDQLVDSIDPDTVATLVYTSGTTGPPKGAMLSHRNIVWVMDRAASGLSGGADLPKHVEILSYLPLCHIAEKLYTNINGLAFEATVNFAESIETVAVDLREVQPTLFLGVPRIWEKMFAGVMIRMQDASLFKRAVFGVAMWAGNKNADRILAKGRRGVVGTISYGIFYLLVYRALKDKLGMRQCVAAFSGAAPIAPEVLKFFMAIGVPIFEGYGQTEGTAWATANRLDNIKLGTVGVPHLDCELRLADDGEILIRHPAVFMGYYRDPEATAETVTADGWLHTGDVGEWDGEHLKIVDRKKHIIITAGGKNLSPSEIENKLKVSPFIREAIVIGDRRKFVSALIGIEYDVVSNWALRKGVTFTTYRDLSGKPEVVELIQQEVNKANEHLARVEEVKQFRLLTKELDHEDGELTATQKVKREKIEQMFGDLIADIYRKAQPVDVVGLVAQITSLSLPEEIIQLTSRGLALGAIYALIALGFVIIYKATQVINFAHGALMLVGLYITYTLVGGAFPTFSTTPNGLGAGNFPSWLQWWLDIDVMFRYPLAIVAAVIVVAILGVLIERSVLRKLVGQPVFVVVLVTLGLELAISTSVQVFWNPQQKVLASPFPVTSTLKLGNIAVQWSNVWTMLVMLVVVALFFAFFKYSRYGVAMRATAHDQEAAMAMGIKASTVFAIGAWAIGGALAAIAGSLFVTTRLSGLIVFESVRFSALGAFPAAILGGLDSPGGAVVGGLSIGVAQVLSARWINPLFDNFDLPNFHLVFPYLLMIGVLLVRPYGLFGTKEVRRV